MEKSVLYYLKIKSVWPRLTIENYLLSNSLAQKAPKFYSVFISFVPMEGLIVPLSFLGTGEIQPQADNIFLSLQGASTQACFLTPNDNRHAKEAELLPFVSL